MQPVVLYLRDIYFREKSLILTVRTLSSLMRMTKEKVFWKALRNGIFWFKPSWKHLTRWLWDDFTFKVRPKISFFFLHHLAYLARRFSDRVANLLLLFCRIYFSSSEECDLDFGGRNHAGNGGEKLVWTSRKPNIKCCFQHFEPVHIKHSTHGSRPTRPYSKFFWARNIVDWKMM